MTNGNKTEMVGYKFDVAIGANFVIPTKNKYFNTTLYMNTTLYLIFQVYWSQMGRVQQIGNSTKFTCSKLYLSFNSKNGTIISRICCFPQRLIKTLFPCKSRHRRLLCWHWFSTELSTVQQTESDSTNIGFLT